MITWTLLVIFAAFGEVHTRPVEVLSTYADCHRLGTLVAEVELNTGDWVPVADFVCAYELHI